MRPRTRDYPTHPHPMHGGAGGLVLGTAAGRFVHPCAEFRAYVAHLVDTGDQPGAKGTPEGTKFPGRIVVAWTIWKHRNRCVFDGIQPSARQVLRQVADEEAAL